MSHLDVRILGPLQARIDDHRLDLGTRKQRALLALLVVNRGKAVSTDRIIMALWGPEAPLARRNDVWAYVSRLRKSLAEEADALERRSDGYVLHLDAESVDADRFERLSNEGRQLLVDDPPAASLVLGEALAMWSGEPFGEFADEEFAAAEGARLEALRLTTLEMRFEADLAWRDPIELLPEIEGLVTDYPTRPRLTAALMLALYRRGRQADALRAYRVFADRLGDEAGLDPPEELRRLEEQILLDDPAVRPPIPELSPRLPEPMAQFIGRRAELQEVGALLSQHRLVTLIGPGGVGKTSLALEVGRRLAVEFDDAVWVDLLGAIGSVDVVSRIAAAMHVDTGGDPMASIRRRIGARRVLLVLDNCETAAAAAGTKVTELMRAAAGLRAIATSRIVLGVEGEQVVRLLPLGTDAGGEAEELLLARISTATGEADALDADTLQRLVEGTAGLPLAIELAAAQLRSFSAGDVADAIERSLDSLSAPERVAPEHHRELRASIEWSERLLPEDTMVLLARLSVFRSSFTAEAVTAAAASAPLDEPSVREGLRRLVDTSLVLPFAGLPGRYRMLEPIRQYAAQRLDVIGDRAGAEEAHAAYFVRQLSSPQQAMADEDEAALIERLRPDYANVRAALERLIGVGDAERAVGTLVAAVPFLKAIANDREIVDLADAVLAIPGEPSRAAAELVFLVAPVYGLVRGTEAYRAKLGEMKRIAAALDDREVDAWAALRLADLAAIQGDPEEVERRYERAVAALRAVDSEFVFNAYHQFGWWLYWQGNRWKRAQEIGEVWWTQAVKMSDAEMATVHGFRSWLAMAARDADRVGSEALITMNLYRRYGNYRMAAVHNGPLATAALWRGDYDEALRRIDLSILASEEKGSVPWVVNARIHRAAINLAAGASEAVVAELADLARSMVRGTEMPQARGVAAIAGRALAAAEPEPAAVLLGAAAAPATDTWFTEAQLIQAPFLDELFGSPEERLRSALGDERYLAAFARGEALDDADVAAVALDALQRVELG